MLTQARRELDVAHSALEKMAGAHDYNEIELQWENLLSRVERCWEKTVLELTPKPKFGGIRSKYEGLRKTDPLLAYLKQARNANEHSLQIVLRADGSRIAKLEGEGGGELVQILHIGNNVFRIIPLNDAARKGLKFYPRCKVLQVENRGAKFPEPKTHLGQNVPNDFLIIGELGIEFYRKALDDIQANLK